MLSCVDDIVVVSNNLKIHSEPGLFATATIFLIWSSVSLVPSHPPLTRSVGLVAKLLR